LRLLRLGALLVVVAATSAGKDFYGILGVPKSAADNVIKRAYRKLSLKFHPDKAQGDKRQAEQRFLEISKAYEVLSDPKKRQLYDRHGEEGLKQMDQGAGRNPFDVFRNFGFGVKTEQQGDQEGPALKVDLKVSLKDIYLGTKLEVLVSRRVPLESATREDNCRQCHYMVTETERRQIAPGFVQQMQKHVKKEYSCCVQEDIVEVEIERGMRDGHEIEFEGYGEHHPDQLPGKLLFKLVVGEEKQFDRKGHDLHAEMSIPLRDALIGFSKQLVHVDGKTKIDVSRDEVTQPGEVMLLKGRGMPIHDYPSTFGDLYIKFHILFPRRINPEQKAVFQRLLPSA